MEREKTAALSVSSEVIDDLVEISDQSQESSDEEFNPSTDPKSYKSESKLNTRSNYSDEIMDVDEEPGNSIGATVYFPQISVRTGYRTINVDKNRAT